MKKIDNKVQSFELYQICEEKDCTGCAACASICEQNAISMVFDNCGFWRPQIDIASCINCGRCKQVCPINSKPEVYGPTKAFAYQNPDELVRFNSTSGGFFSAVANQILNEGGVVCGAKFDENMHLVHTFVERKEELDPLQRSKYVQSSLDGVFCKIRDYLKEDRLVLFVGVGCQAAALRKYIGDNKKLIIMDLVCYGVPSPGLFDDWIKYLEKKYGKVKDVWFRDKTYGYASPNVKVVFSNGKYIETCRDSSIFSDLFFRHLSIRECCYDCQFKTIDRSSDITLGDLWLVKKYCPDRDDNKGTTVVFSHTEKGGMICKRLCEIQLDTNEIVSADSRKMVEKVSPASGVNEFWRKYGDDGFQSVVNLYERDTIKSKIKYPLKKIMNKTGISFVYYKWKKRKSVVEKSCNKEGHSGCNT